MGQSAQTDGLDADFSTTSSSYVDVDNGSGDDMIVTIANQTGGEYILHFTSSIHKSSSTARAYVALEDGSGTYHGFRYKDFDATSHLQMVSLNDAGETDGRTRVVQTKTGGGTVVINGQSETFTRIAVLEVW